MSTSNDPVGIAPADAPGGEEAANRYRAAVTALIEVAVERRELVHAASALARGYAEVIYGCNSLAVAGDMMRMAGNRLIQIAADGTGSAAAESRPEGATLQ